MFKKRGRQRVPYQLLGQSVAKLRLLRTHAFSEGDARQNSAEKERKMSILDFDQAMKRGSSTPVAPDKGSLAVQGTLMESFFPSPTSAIGFGTRVGCNVMKTVVAVCDKRVWQQPDFHGTAAETRC